MKSFKDTKDRTWQLEVNCDTIDQVKQATAWNILDLLDPQSDLAQFESKYPPMLGQLLFAALADQAKTKGVDDREFRRSIDGDVLSAARDCLLEEIISFSPKHRRTVAAAVLKKQQAVQEAAAELALAKLADPELQAKVMQALETSLAAEMRAAVARLEETSGIASSSAAGMPPACSASPALDLTPGGSSAG